jgi:hypothetical protein
MSQTVYNTGATQRICSHLEKMLARLPIGTNKGIYQIMMAMVSGRFLESRGAVFPALEHLGLPPDAVRRSSAALRNGKYKTQDLLHAWQQSVQKEGYFTPHCYGGFCPVACDMTGFLRPQLKHNPAKHYVAEAGKALPAIVLGIAVAVGRLKNAAVFSSDKAVGTSRFALPRLLVRWEPGDAKEASVQTRLIEQAGKALTPHEVAVFDAGFSLAEVRGLVPRFVVRMAKNDTMRRNVLPEYKGVGRHPEYGQVVRPLARTHNGRALEASDADEIYHWQEGSVCLHAQIWKELVLPAEKVGASTLKGGVSTLKGGVSTLTVVAIFDPRHKDPLLLATNLEVCAQVLHDLYRDRWAVEHLPLAGKPLLGCGSAFVFGQESRLRLPELALLSGNVLSYVAATCPAVATGFWDRACRATCGRLRRVLNRLDFSELPVMGEQLRKKASVTSHLKTGVEGHRRQKAPNGMPGSLETALI